MTKTPRRPPSARSVLATIAAVPFLIAGLVPAVASAVGDLTPPTGAMEYWAMDNETQLAELRFAYSDPESGLAQIKFICDGGADYVVPYTTTVFLPMHDGSAGCSTAYGNHEVLAWVVNGDGLESNQQYAAVANGPTLSLGVSVSPTTGHALTITPILPADYAIPAGSACSWEFRWGTTQALDVTFGGESFGGMYFVLPASAGGCGPWTFTLPWVPYRQFDVIVILGTPDPGPDLSFGARAHERFTAAVDSTDRRILSSNLPVAQVLPSTYTPIVGRPITYTRYLVGGATGCCSASWSARLGDGENPIVWSQAGGSTFTITPPVPGDVFVQWTVSGANNRFLNVYYDPPVRYRDTRAPVTSPPVERIRPTAVGTTIPIAIAWGGTDVGWGIASFQLQRSLNGGTWTTVGLPTATAKSVGVAGLPGSTLQFRVRARDKAGNVGRWTYGPLIHVARISDNSKAVHYSSGWSVATADGALGGWRHQTTSAGAASSFTFSGRDVAWLAERGPGQGKAKVYLDGAYQATVDLGAASAGPPTVVYARHLAAYGTHTLRIVNLATIGRTLIDIDGFAVLR